MTEDDLWGDDSKPSEDNGPQGIPAGSKVVTVVNRDGEQKTNVMAKYAKLAGRPETIKHVKIVTERLTELAEMGELEVPDESMGTFGLITLRYGFHGETVKMAIKFEVDETLERSVPHGLLEVIQQATDVPEAMTNLCEMFFAMGYSFALDGSLSVSKSEDE